MSGLARNLTRLGTVVSVLGLSKVHAAWNGYDFTDSSRFGWAIAYVGVLILAAYALGLPDLPRDRRGALLWASAATAVSAVAVSLVQLFSGDALLPRFVVFSSALTLVPWYTACSVLAMQGRRRAESRDRVVVVADPTEAKPLRDDLDEDPERPAHLVEVIKLDEARSNGANRRPLSERVLEDHASVLVLSRTAQLDETIVSQAAAAHESGVRVRSTASFYEEWLGKLPITELERMAVLFDIGEVHQRRYVRIKRMLDVSFGILGLIPLTLALPFVVVGNLVGNAGPLLYRQRRVGKNGAEFDILKFRTMKPLGGHLVNEWTQEDDPRITPFGRFLRRMHIDELPQVINILAGDLSIVGPRPEQPQYVRWLLDRIAFYDMRHWVRPGLTGWAQVKHGYAGCEVDAIEKLQYDIYYLRNQSLSLDVRIIARTLRSLLSLGGR